MLELSGDMCNREKHSGYEQPTVNFYLDISSIMNKVYNFLVSGNLQLYQVVDPDFVGLVYQPFSIYAAENIDQARSYIEHHLSGVDIYTNEEIRRSLQTIKPFDLFSQATIDLDLFINLYDIISDIDWPGYVGQTSL